MKTLTERAKEMVAPNKRHKDFSEEKLDLVVAILHGEVTLRQGAKVLGIGKVGNMSHLVGSTIREGIRLNLVKLTRIK